MALLSTLIANNMEDQQSKLVNLKLLKQIAQSSTTNLGGKHYLFVNADKTPEENAQTLKTIYQKAINMPRYIGSFTNIDTIDLKAGQTFIFDGERGYIAKNDVNIIPESPLDEYSDYITLLSTTSYEESVRIAKKTRTTIILSPGEFNFGESGFSMNEIGIDIVSLTGSYDVIFNKIKVDADDVYVKGVYASSFFVENKDNVIIENCGSGDNSFCESDGESSYGTYINCKAGDFSFGKTTSNGTYINCTARDNSFGGETSNGTYKNCKARDYSFRSASGIYINCTARSYCWDFLFSQSKLLYCRIEQGTFGSNTSEGKIVMCIDGDLNVVTR